MTKILVAIDIARHGGNDMVLATAKKLATAMEGEIHLFHALEPIPKHILSEMPEEVASKSRTFAEEGLAKLVAEHGCADGALREGPPSSEILAYAEEINADLIVLHSHDPDLSDYFLGSVASRVVRHAHCSVHIVRHPDR